MKAKFKSNGAIITGDAAITFVKIGIAEEIKEQDHIKNEYKNVKTANSVIRDKSNNVNPAKKAPKKVKRGRPKKK